MTSVQNAVLGFLAACIATAPAWTQTQHPATCTGYMATMQAAVRSQDPLGPQAYIDLADSMYVAINTSIVGRGMAPLPLLDDEDSKAARAMMVVSECQRSPALSYAEAITAAYIKMRQAAGLSVELPPL